MLNRLAMPVDVYVPPKLRIIKIVFTMRTYLPFIDICIEGTDSVTLLVEKKASEPKAAYPRYVSLVGALAMVDNDVMSGEMSPLKLVVLPSVIQVNTCWPWPLVP